MPLVGLLILGSVCADVGSQPSEYPVMEALSMLIFGAPMKVLLAKRLTSKELLISYFGSLKLQQMWMRALVIIGERNRAAIEAVGRAIEEGHHRICHPYWWWPHARFGKQLWEKFDLFTFGVEWITTWSIRNRDVDGKSLPFLKTMAKF